MTATVRYYCPRCETVVAIEREGYLADKSVTPFPLEGWTYVEAAAFVDPGARDDPDGEVEAADGVRFVCGESAGVEWRAEGCGELFYLNFLRFEDGREVEPAPESEYVTLAEGSGPRGPRGPRGPG